MCAFPNESPIPTNLLQELGKLENSALTGFVRTLDVGHIKRPLGWRNNIVQETLARILPSLESLQWLELGSTEMSTAIFAAVHTHRTLQTVAIQYLPIYELLPQFPVNLEKLLLHSSTTGRKKLAMIQSRNIRLIRLNIRRDHPPLETIVIPSLHEVDIMVDTEETLRQLHSFIAHHPRLMKIIFNRVHRFWDQCSSSILHLLSFLNVGDAHSLRRCITCFDATLTPLKSSSRTGLDRWEATQLSFSIKSSFLETLSLEGTMFPKLSFLTLCDNSKAVIHASSFVALISTYFRNLRVLDLTDVYNRLIWTPLLIPIPPDMSGQSFDDAAARMQWLASHLFQASPSMTSIKVQVEGCLPGSMQWIISARYLTRMDVTTASIKMDINRIVTFYDDDYSMAQRPPITFRGSVAL
ncbi:hypothetical protein C8J56DRAFT_933296 [Mycena floridula]|nr:hypothetical protein C8J56DRAFT_933296 [Mycena floridula]